ncbi:hypothetical protein A2U01_0107416, partial [Trifolium medium]|nr:hypothetical protein [Trifolium medium]
MVGGRKCHQNIQKAANTTAEERKDKSTTVKTPNIRGKGKQHIEGAPMEIIPNNN